MITIHEERQKELKARFERERKRDREEARQLTDIVERIVDIYKGEMDISPSWVATQAMTQAGATAQFQRDKSLLYKAGHLEFRQLARGVCRKKWEEEDVESEQHELFQGLQKRYPIAKQMGEEPVYRLLEHLTEADLDYNINRMQAEVWEKQAHVDALKAFKALKVEQEGLAS